jgi:MFS family permease
MENETVENTNSTVLPYAWVILVVVFLASIAAPFNQAKVPPLIPVLMDAFQLSLGQAGLLMSVFALTGLFLAFPAAIFLEKLGPKILGTIALGCLVIGAGFGALSSSLSMLLVSRVIEGSGMGLLAVVAPAAIAMWFPPEKRGIPMGIWATWMPVGTILIYVIAPPLVSSTGWQSVWWLGTGFAAIIMVVYGLLVRMPPSMEKTDLNHTEGSIIQNALTNKMIWLLGVEFGCFALIFRSFVTFFPTYLSEVRGYSLTQAAYIASIPTALVLISAPLAGMISDRIDSRRQLFTIPFLAIALMFFIPFKIVGWQIYVFLVVFGFIAGAVPTATFAAAPEIMAKPELAGIGMAIVMMGQNLGFFIGPILFGNLVERMGWVSAGYWLIPVSILGFIVGWKVKVR